MRMTASPLRELRVLIVDDEKPARRHVRNLLQADTTPHSFHEAGNGEEAVRMIHEYEPDLLLLDTRMPGLNGMRVVEAIGSHAMPITVFILKPFSDERFHNMMRNLKERHANVNPTENRSCHYLDRFAIKVKETFRFLLVENVAWIEAAGVYVTIHAGAEKVLYRISLTELARSLNPRQFLRVHRSVIVNIDRIVQMRVRSHGELEAILDDGSTLRVSRTYRAALEGRLGQRLR